MERRNCSVQLPDPQQEVDESGAPIGRSSGTSLSHWWSAGVPLCFSLFFSFFFPTPRLIDAHISIIHSAPDELLKGKVWFYVSGYSIFNAETSWEDGNSGAVREKKQQKTYSWSIYLRNVYVRWGDDIMLPHGMNLCVVQGCSGLKQEARHDPPELQVFIAAHR